jgi:hypothetical protein
MTRRRLLKTKGIKSTSFTTALASQNAENNCELRKKEKICKEALREVQSFTHQVWRRSSTVHRWAPKPCGQRESECCTSLRVSSDSAVKSTKLLMSRHSCPI